MYSESAASGFRKRVNKTELKNLDEARIQKVVVSRQLKYENWGTPQEPGPWGEFGRWNSATLKHNSLLGHGAT